MRPVLKEWIWSGGVYLAGLLFFWFSLPEPLFREPTSYLIESREGALLGARVAADGQWRFPAGPAIPEKFTQALITFEDKRFYRDRKSEVWGTSVSVGIDIGGWVIIKKKQ